jgi:hypothetical protein
MTHEFTFEGQRFLVDSDGSVKIWIEADAGDPEDVAGWAYATRGETARALNSELRRLIAENEKLRGGN